MRKVIRPIRSCVLCFFTCEPYRELKFSFKGGWCSFVHRTSHRFASLKRANSSVLFAILPSLILKVPVSAKTTSSEKRFVILDSSVEEYVESLEVSFGFYLSSFAFYEASFFQ